LPRKLMIVLDQIEENSGAPMRTMNGAAGLAESAATYAGKT
jgi:mevalonate pyrophosphate decarboxylase